METTPPVDTPPRAGLLDELAQRLLAVAEIIGNRLLDMDQETLQRCRELQGHIVAIEFTDLERSLYFHPGAWGLRVSLQPPYREVDAVIRGRLAGLASLSRQQDKISTSIQERIEITGNTRVAQKFQGLLTGIDIDWEEQLAQYTGDIAAFRIGQGLRKTRQWLEDSFDSLALSGREYLQEEAHHLPTKPEFEAFSEAVTELRDDVERLEALINHRYQPDK